MRTCVIKVLHLEDPSSIPPTAMKTNCITLGQSFF